MSGSPLSGQNLGQNVDCYVRYDNNNNNDILYSAGIRLKEGAHGAFAENIIDKYS